jgi:hypothetical protein
MIYMCCGEGFFEWHGQLGAMPTLVVGMGDMLAKPKTSTASYFGRGFSFWGKISLIFRLPPADSCLITIWLFSQIHSAASELPLSDKRQRIRST